MDIKREMQNSEPPKMQGQIDEEDAERSDDDDDATPVQISDSNSYKIKSDQSMKPAL